MRRSVVLSLLQGVFVPGTEMGNGTAGPSAACGVSTGGLGGEL